MLATKIVCTIGPASQSPEMLAQLIKAGMNVARINMSHGTHDYHAETIRRLRTVAGELGAAVAVLVDLQGPKLRVATLPAEGVQLVAGQSVTLTVEDVPATTELVPVQFKRLPAAVRVGERILLDDGLLELQVQSKDDKNVVCRIVVGGVLTSHKGINLPTAALSINAITSKDEEDLGFALDQRADWVALSFVRQASDVLQLKDMIRQRSPFGRMTPVLAKIEKPEAVANIDEIVEVVDGIMVARGDLGIETSPEAVPLMQKMIIHKCNEAGIPVITATQMLDSMIRNPRPTRAEASDVANAILDGTDAIMLSGETAVGKYPLEAVQTMARIAEQVEAHTRATHVAVSSSASPTISEAVCHAATDTVMVLGASAIIAPTVHGSTVRTLSKFRPPAPIIAITPNPAVQHQLALYWGVHPLLSRRAPDTDTVIQEAVAVALRSKLIQEGETVVITAGTGGLTPGVTDLIKVVKLARTLAHGTGVGASRVVGRIRHLEAPLPDAVYVNHDEIVVASTTDRSFVEPLRNAAGFISADGGPTSHCYLLAVDLGLPAVVGVDNIDVLEEGQWVVLDAERGVVVERLGMHVDI
jgi:pyruvate kinase